MSPTARLVCPLCSADFPSVETVDGLAARYRCEECGYERVDRIHVDVSPDAEAEEGVLESLGLYDDLPHCVVAGEPWVEYGIVEYRYRLLQPSRFNVLVNRNEHLAIRRKQNTASNLIGMALGHLERQGVLAYRNAPGTGFWRHNQDATFWARVPAKAEKPNITWTSFVAGGLDGTPINESWVMSAEAIRGGLTGHPIQRPEGGA